VSRADSGERWARLEELCTGALEVPLEERGAWLLRAADGNSVLEAEVRSLLSYHDPDFLARPASTVRAMNVDLAGAEPVAASLEIAGYRLIRPLGRGGMGDVYLAARDGDDYQRFVALKVVRRGLDSEEVVARFRRERRILSSLTHPNICGLVDGGLTTDGRPYFVMEYVDGRELTEWASATRAGLRHRIEVFLQVVSAVQHAHRSLVIHRDLKPSNILVTETGDAKLLDFGIAKLLDGEREPDVEESFRTRAGRQVLTPEYAAPEQLDDHGSVTTATDVYSLGVLLYELVAGGLPWSSEASTRKTAREGLDPPGRSTRDGTPGGGASGPGHSVDRDLDMIVLKALQTDPLRRYASASAMAEDLRRWLEGRPILARPSTWRYRARKFVQRRPWAASTVVATGIALVALGALPWVAAHRADIERDRALEVQGFLLEMFGATGGDAAVGDTLTARTLLDRQADLVGELYTDDPDMRARMLRVVAEGYDRLGLADDAEAHARTALALEREHGGLSPDGLAASLNTLGWVLHQQGDREEAKRLLEEAVERRRSQGRRYRSELARALNDLAVVLDAEGAYDRSARLHQEAFELRMSENGPASRGTAVSASNLAVAHYRQGDFEAAQEFGAVSLEGLRNSVGADHQRSIIAQNNLAAFRVAAGNLEGARAEYLDLLDRQTRLQGRAHPVTTGIMGSLATVEVLLESGEAAETLAREALAIEAERWGEGDPRSGETLRLLGRALVLQGRFEEGIVVLDRALEDLRRLLGPEHREVAATGAAMAEAYAAAGRPAEAIDWQRRTVDAYLEAYGPDHPETERQRERLRDLEPTAPKG